MDSTVHAHMDTCSFKREQVICSDNVWLSEVMFGNRCGTRVRWHPMVDLGIPNAISCGHWRAVLPHGNPRAYTRFSRAYTRFPRAYTRFSQELHKNRDRNQQEIHKKLRQNNHMESNRNPAEITSVFHVKTLEYVCHTGRTY